MRIGNTSIITVATIIAIPLTLVLYFGLFRPLIAPTIYEWATDAITGDADRTCAAFTLERYKTPDLYIGPIAEIDFSANEDLKEFRTAIRKDMQRGVTYAGHYTVASWGCGTNCQQYAIIDARTGRVVQADLSAEFGAQYYATSSLLILNPTQNIPRELSAEFRVRYYRMKDGALKLLCEKPSWQR